MKLYKHTCNTNQMIEKY